MPSFPSQLQGTSSIPSLMESMPSIPSYLNIDEIPNIEKNSPLRTPPKILHRKPKYFIDIDENILQPMEDKIPKHTCRRYAHKIWRVFLEKLNDTRRCQLFVETMRSIKYRSIMKILGLRTSEASSEKSIVKNLMSAHESVGNTPHTKDSNVTQCVFTLTIVSNQMKKDCIFRKTSQALRINKKSLSRAIGRCQIIANPSIELYGYAFHTHTLYCHKM